MHQSKPARNVHLSKINGIISLKQYSSNLRLNCLRSQIQRLVVCFTAIVYYAKQIIACGNVNCYILKQCHKKEALLLRKYCISVKSKPHSKEM